MFRSTSEFDKQLDKATSHLLLEPDWQAIIQICDIICQGDCQPKYAITAIKKRFYNQNPYVALYSLQVLESVVKNCGSPIHDEVASKVFMDELRELVHKSTNERVRAKILELIQTWAFAFRSSPKYSIIPDTLNILKAEGYTFPALQESDAMFAADRAPDWSDGDNCHRCRVQFSVMVRRHHCRACGQIFCGKCTTKSCTLPKYGIEKEVRVCEDCYEKHNSDPRASSKDEVESSSKPASAEAKADKTRKEEELKLQEEEELQLALALSRSEAEHKQKENGKSSSIRSYSSPAKTSENTAKVTASEIDDPELARYLNRSYWEQKQQDKEDYRDKENQREKEMDKTSSGGGGSVMYPSAPITSASPLSVNNTLKTTEKYQNGEVDEVDEFCSTLSSQLDIFVNRMKSNSSRGRSIANDSSVQTLFLNITTMHSRLMQYIQQQENARVYYEGLQDKLTQGRDARAALDALREEHRERLRREAEEAERQRQMQMALKLEIMRKKKQEYLQYQRQLAMQRMQEEEREMQMRMEQQKHMYIRGQMPMQMPGMPPNMPGYPPQQLPQLQQQQQQQSQLPYMAQPPSYEHRMPYAMPPYPGSNGTMQSGPVPPVGASGAGGPNMMLGPGGPAGAGMMAGPGVPPGGPGVLPGPYGNHPSYPYTALPPHSMYPHQQQQQQPASAPAAGNNYGVPGMMMGHPIPSHPPQQLQQQQPPQQQPLPNEAAQPAVAELISFD